MNKLVKRLLTGTLAFATILTALPVTAVHASGNQYWTESAERVGYIEHVMNEELAEALKQLPEQSRNIVLMFFFLDMSDSEIGEKLNINRSTSYRHRRNSLEEIRKQLKEKKTNEE